jgi:hypothetical protein
MKPAGLVHQVWLKWQVLEDYVDLDARDGMASDRWALFALACVKADLVYFGFGKRMRHLPTGSPTRRNSSCSRRRCEHSSPTRAE